MLDVASSGSRGSGVSAAQGRAKQHGRQRRQNLLNMKRSLSKGKFALCKGGKESDVPVLSLLRKAFPASMTIFNMLLTCS